MPYTCQKLTDKMWEEVAPHTLGCFGVVRPITGWCDTVFAVQLFMRCNAHACLLWTTEMPSKNHCCQWASQCHDQSDPVRCQQLLLTSASTTGLSTLRWATHGSRKTFCFVFTWQLAYLKTGSEFHTSLSPGQTALYLEETKSDLLSRTYANTILIN